MPQPFSSESSFFGPSSLDGTDKSIYTICTVGFHNSAMNCPAIKYTTKPRAGGTARGFRPHRLISGPSDQTAQRAGRIGVHFLGHTARLVGQPPRLDSQLHRPGHLDGVFGACDRGIHQHAITPQLHRHGGVGGGAHAGIHQHRHADTFLDETDVDGVHDAQPRTDERPQRALWRSTRCPPGASP